MASYPRADVTKDTEKRIYSDQRDEQILFEQVFNLKECLHFLVINKKCFLFYINAVEDSNRCN